MARGEKRLSNRLGDRLNCDLWLPVENTVGEGTPDIFMIWNGTGAWCELKHVHAYPVRPATAIRFHRFTAIQAATIDEIGRLGLPSTVLVQVGADHYVFPHTAARMLRIGQPRYWWDQHCVGFWKNRLDYDQLRTLLFVAH
jgi:hypothetical protein